MTTDPTAPTGTPAPEVAASPGDELLVARNLRKAFGSVQALKDGSITVRRGTVTALIGDNGAGKSTLVRCLSGVHAPDAGELLFDGRPVRFSVPEQAQAAGIETVHQDLALVEELTVWQNLFLTREITRGLGPIRLLDRRAMRERARELVGSLAINVPGVTQRVKRLSGGQRQAVSIVRAAGWGSQMVIMDEPTAALGVQETARVEELIRDLRSRGLTVLLISHNFDQVLRLADEVWVMRSGRSVAHRRTEGTTGEDLVGLVTGAITA
ncbi:ATP-binding cassette domain-containing protein [Blastococcus sp. SYSU DS0619]